MKKVLLLFCAVLSSTWWVKAQQTALEFDGVDDFMEISVLSPPTALDVETYTIEFIVKDVVLNNTTVFFSFPQANGRINFGITIDGFLFIDQFGEINVFDRTDPIQLEGCHHIAYSVSNDLVEFFHNGVSIGFLNLVSNTPLTNNSTFFVGLDQTNPTTALQGIVDEIRIWSGERSSNDIAQWAFVTPPFTTSQYLLLQFLEGSGYISYSAYNHPLNFATWSTNTQNTLAWVGGCLEDDPFAIERLGGGVVQCTAPQNPLNMICNGNFEDFHPILTTPTYSTLPGVLANGQAFMPDVNGNTDVASWKAGQISPDIWIRNGIGGVPAGMPLNIWNTHFVNTHNFPATGNDAMAGLKSTYNESLINSLLYNAKSGMRYKLSGWFYATQTLIDSGYNNVYLELKLKNGQSTFNGIPNIHVINRLEIGGWQYIEMEFGIPCTPYVEYTKLEIRAKKNTNNSEVYVLMDDLEMVPIDFAISDQFPQTISLNPNSGTLAGGNSYHDYKSNMPVYNPSNLPYTMENHHNNERQIETDDIGNTYVAAYINYDNGTHWFSQYNPIVTYGANPGTNRSTDGFSAILLSKYDRCGMLLWQHTISNRNNTTLVELEVTGNGDVYVCGNATNANSFHRLTTSSGQMKPNTVGDRMFVAQFNTTGTCTGLQELTGEQAVDMEIHPAQVAVITGNAIWDVDLLSGSFIQLGTFTGTGLKSTLQGNNIIVAEASSNNILLRRYNIFTGLVSGSPSQAITHNNTSSNACFGFPHQTISDMLCDGNGNVFLLGNFSNGLDFAGGTPSASSFTSIFQDYTNTGFGLTGFVAKYSSGLGFIKADYLEPDLVFGQMVQVLDYYTTHCTPPTGCDVVTTATTNQCDPTYFCVHLKWQWQQDACTLDGLFVNLYQDLSIDADNNVLVSGILRSADWGGNTYYANSQPFVCKYDNSLNRAWLNETQGDVGIENTNVGHTTGIAYDSFSNQHRVVGNFIGNIKLFDTQTLNTGTTNEHIFIANLQDLGSEVIFKQDSDVPYVVADDVKYRVFPNPSKFSFIIETSSDAEYSYELFNNLGQKVKNGVGTGTTQVQTTSLASGVYMLHLAGEKSEVIKVVIQ